jgi:asparagine synthase (glutamine-hydrolysing)
VVVRDHLVADVPVGVFLSSGLDSTIVAGIAAKYTPKLRSFTVGFADQPDMSEQALATETAKLFGLEHTNIDVVGSDAEKYVAMWLASLDQPSMDGLNVYVISKVIRERGITVALSGQGGDELFGGYPSFRDVPRLRHLLHRMRNVPRLLRTAGARLATAGKPMAVRQKLLDMMASDGSVHELALQRRRAMSRSQLSALGIDAAALGLDPSFQLPESVAGLEDCDDIVALISRCESQFYQGNMLLRDGDTNGMANSLEIRVPMLDQRMLDLAHSLPGSMRLPPDAPGKHLLRVAFAPLLRPVLAQQGKRGFSLPLRRWMMGPLRERCEAGLRILKSMSILEPRGVDAVWQEFLRDPESPTWSRALTLVVLGVYVEQLRATA